MPEISIKYSMMKVYRKFRVDETKDMVYCDK